jgi:hypothetical protein
MRQEALFLAAVLPFLGGCATMIHGRYQEVAIESIPPGATATVTPLLSERGPLFLDPRKQQSVTTPATVRLRRDNSYRIEIAKPGYRIGSKKVETSYDWLWAPVTCGPCEAVGDLPTYDLKNQPWPLRFLEGAFYEYPKGFIRALGRGLRIFSPEALLGNSFKLRPEGGGFFSDWHALGTPRVSATLEPTGS